VKPRERPGPAALIQVPPELRMFSDPSRADGRGPGMDAYPDRAAWLAARRAWEAEHGMTCTEWYDALLAELQASRPSLEELNANFCFYFTEEDEDEDPRLTA
jgi:hypothetical protein